mgnify:CR=1 FL=1
MASAAIKAKDTLVRTSLARHCELLGLTTETALLLEFTPAVRQPELMDKLRSALKDRPDDLDGHRLLSPCNH